MTDIFKCKETMPPKEMSDDVVRTAQTPTEVRFNYESATASASSRGVKSVQRPRYGHSY